MLMMLSVKRVSKWHNGRMSVERWTPERRRQHTRDTLLDAAEQVFARRGFDGASLDDIADTAGFTRGAIYKHFADKEDLYLAVWDRFNDRSLHAFTEMLDEEGSRAFDDVHIGSVASVWRQLFEDRNFFVLGLEFNLYSARNPDVRERVASRRHEGVLRVAQFMEDRASAAGIKLPLPTEDLAYIFLITSEAFSGASVIDPDAARLYEPFLDLFVHGVVARQTTTAAPTQS
jgi:AcrR family transcriptional regulator